MNVFRNCGGEAAASARADGPRVGGRLGLATFFVPLRRCATAKGALGLPARRDAFGVAKDAEGHGGFEAQE